MATSAPYTAQARELISDLYKPKPWVYWIDLLLTLTVAYSAAVVFLNPGRFSASLVTQLVCYAIAGIGLFRAALFMHEIVHFRRGEMVAFKVGWNLLAGIPMLVPSFLYESHLVHHNTRHYGTVNDGEYLPLGVGRLRNLLEFLGQILLLPAFVAFRFLILTPISFLHPRLRLWVLERASSFVINFSYRRAIPDNAPRKVWALVEIACFFRTAAIFAFVTIGIAGMEANAAQRDDFLQRIPRLYAIAMLTLGLNHVRTLAAHRYRSTGKRMNHAEQVQDSVNIRGNWFWTEFIFPVGLRWHGLHHMFPLIPYHNLGIAHRRLAKGLPADSPYHEITLPSFWSAVGGLLKSSREACQNPPPGSDLWYASRKEMLQAIAPNDEDREAVDEVADEVPSPVDAPQAEAQKETL